MLLFTRLGGAGRRPASQARHPAQAAPEAAARGLGIGLQVLDELLGRGAPAELLRIRAHVFAVELEALQAGGLQVVVDEAGARAGDQVDRAVRRIGGDRRARAHRFQNHQAEGVGPTGEDEDVGIGEATRRILVAVLKIACKNSMTNVGNRIPVLGWLVLMMGIWMRGPYKAQAFDILKKRGVPVGTILDVGVLTGTPELIQSFPDKKHILFEPVNEFNPDILEAYKGIESELHNVAVSDFNGSSTLDIRMDINAGEISHSNLSFRNADEGREVCVVTLDEFLKDREYNQPYFLKIDVDGLEVKILNGAERTLPLCSVVMIEADKANLVERLSFMLSRGFELYDFAEPAYYDDAFWQCDLIFVNVAIYNRYFRRLEDGLDISKYVVFR